jgi:predicted Zn-dependent protease with MMP-like domain/Flp pilus assembly protein TadD
MELEPPGILPNEEHPGAGPDPIVQQIEVALDEGRDEDALALCEDALAAGTGDRLDLLFLAGDALLALGDAKAAEVRFRAVLQDDPSCPSSRCWLAMALYRQGRFAEAETEAAAALACEQPMVDAHVVSGLLLDRRGDFAAADAAYQRASELDPEKYHLPERLTREEFDRELRKAVKRLPKQFRKHLERVPVIVQDVPAEHLLRTGEDAVHDPDLLGLFDGVPLGETADGLGGEVARPNYIFLFQRNLERYAQDRDDLVEQIAVTIYHELGHYLGMDEDDLDELGLG